LFYRRFALPDSANAEGVTASGSHGVLEITIPKKPETRPRRISVNVG
jgi:HSP20 family protein